MKKLLVILLCLFSLMFYGQVEGKIVKVKDGDTVVLLDAENKMITIRLAGVDCPEKNQDYGTTAKKFTSDAIFGKQVKFERISTDLYGRQIGWVYYDTDKNLSEELLKNGLAWHYRKYDNSKILEGLEQVARKDKINIWSKDNPIFPEEFRKLKKSKKK